MTGQTHIETELRSKIGNIQGVVTIAMAGHRIDVLTQGDVAELKQSLREIFPDMRFHGYPLKVIRIGAFSRNPFPDGLPPALRA